MRILLYALEHDPEKWEPVFGKRSCSNKELERDGDSKKNHPALGRGWNAIAEAVHVPAPTPVDLRPLVGRDMMFIGFVSIKLTHMSLKLGPDCLERAELQLIVYSSYLLDRRPDEIFVSDLAEVLRRDLCYLREEIAIEQIHAVEHILLEVGHVFAERPELRFLTALSVKESAPK